jgi:DNA (cytosine-5)-methyltransferase 1
MLEEAGKPYVIENVMGAKKEMNRPILLCGTMFDLFIARHRLFETSFELSPFDLPPHPMCKGIQLQYAYDHDIDPRHMSIAGKAINAGQTSLWKSLMGWPAERRTSQRDLKEAIPPVYAKWLGERLMEELA